MLELVAYWHAGWRVWVLLVQDENGNQRFDCEYYPNRGALLSALQGA